MTDARSRISVRRRTLRIDPELLPADLHPVVRRVYAARGIREGGELATSLEHLEPHDRLSNIGAAARLLADKIAARKRILIVGDFDADGATSSALAVLGLRALGAAEVDFLVPNRFEHGYGLTPEIVELALARRPDLIVTVDNGIASVEGVAAAREAGVAVLITDHHLPGGVLPAADAIVNPNLPGDAFPSKHLAGVGVIFYVLAALRGELRRRGRLDEAGGPRLADLLDLVALGTVADVVPLDRNNRILVANGLARIRAGRTRPGIRALLETAGRNPQRTVASDLGYTVAPRLNAAGRLDDMSLGIACLLSGDPAEAVRLAAELDGLNRERREIEAVMRDEALAMVDAILTPEQPSGMPFGLCLFDPRWHPGVIGIVASRLKDSYHRPVIVFAQDGEQHLRGSARSVSGVHIRDTLDALATAHPGLLRKFGGHAMAAGLTIRAADYARFCDAFDAEVRRQVDASQLEGVLWSDGELSGDSLNMDLAMALREGGPWGQAFPEPLFDGAFIAEEKRVVGESHLKMRVRPAGGGRVLDCIAFNQAAMLNGPRALELVYRLDVNEFRGMESLQLVVDHMAPQA